MRSTTKGIPKDAQPKSLASEMSQKLGGLVILQKGAQDIISNARRTEILNVPGGLKRCGGQGDILSGTVATFLAWGKVYEDTWYGLYVFILVSRKIKFKRSFDAETVTRLTKEISHFWLLVAHLPLRAPHLEEHLAGWGAG